MEPEEKIFAALGLDIEILKTGCCGMAGAFGFEKEHFNLSAKIGNLSLLPAVRQAGADTEVITDGFSCREQVQQFTEKSPLHLAQVLKKVLGL